MEVVYLKYVTNENNKLLKKSCENIENVDVIEASMLNVYQLLKPKNIILELNAVEKIQALWGNPEFKAPAKKAPAKKAPAKKTRKTVKKDA